MPSQSDLKTRLAQIDWSRFFTVYGAAINVPEQIERLNSIDEKVALSGTYDLQAGLCHQEVQIASAALPALPFILECLPGASEKVTAEVLFLLVGFVVTTDPVRAEQYDRAMGRAPEPQFLWEVEVRAELRKQLPRIEAFATHKNPDIAEFANRFVREFNSTFGWEGES